MGQIVARLGLTLYAGEGIMQPGIRSKRQFHAMTTYDAKPKNDETLKDTQKTFAATLEEAALSLDGEKTVTVRHMLQLVGEQGLLIFCMILMLPFLLPISVPGVSTVFSVVVILVGISVTTNWLWLPERIMNRHIDAKSMVNSMRSGAKTFSRIDGFIRPRMLWLTHTGTMNRFNGLVLIFGGILLIFPFGLIPLSNTLPGVAILLLAAGIIQRDGLMVILSYAFTGITVFYFGALLVAALAAGQGLLALFGA
jgi:hypothetical protein